MNVCYLCLWVKKTVAGGGGGGGRRGKVEVKKDNCLVMIPPKAACKNILQKSIGRFWLFVFGCFLFLAFWRLILCLSVVYELALIFLLFQVCTLILNIVLLYLTNIIKELVNFLLKWGVPFYCVMHGCQLISEFVWNFKLGKWKRTGLGACSPLSHMHGWQIPSSQTKWTSVKFFTKNSTHYLSMTL